MIPILPPSLSMMVEVELLSSACAYDKVDEVVAAVDCLSRENPEVVAEPRRIELDMSDALASNSLLLEVPLADVVDEASTVDGVADTLRELVAPSAVKFFRRFACHSCSLPVYSCLLLTNSREDTHETTWISMLNIH
jgi:hypothetical protein